MDKIVSLISSAPNIGNAKDDDFADRLSSRYSVALLVAFAVLVGMNQYVRNPITCWAPVHFTGAHTKFVTNYCWVKNTYYLPWEEELPSGHDTPDKRQMIPYYQWIPFILLAQALMFYLPTLVWHGLNQKAGVDADNILATAHTFSRIDKVDSQDRTMKMLRNQVDRFLTVAKQTSGCSCDLKSLFAHACCHLCGIRVGNYLVILFLVSKLIYIANVIGQLFLLNAVLRTTYNTFGPDMIQQMYAEEGWANESFVAFPRVTLCDFRIRGQDFGNVQRYTVQCVLPINLYNEKIYMFLWFWMVFVAGVSVLSLVVWLARAVSRVDRRRFIQNHLMLGSRLKGISNPNDKLRKFTQEYLRQDGTFLMRLIAHNCNNVVTTEIICSMWDFWLERQPESEENDNSNYDHDKDKASLTKRK